MRSATLALPCVALAALLAPKAALAAEPPPYASRYAPPPAAPSLAITPMIGYQLGGIVTTVDGDFKIRDAPTYGAAIDFGIAAGTSLEIGYRAHETALDVATPGGYVEHLYGLTTHYFEAGAKQQFFLTASVRPFAGIAFGGALFAPHARLDNDLFYMGSLFGGASVRVARDLTLRAQAKVSTIFLSGSSSLLCSAYYGCARAFGGVGLPQFEIALGPTFAF
jgi:hypothetical protein